MKLKNCYFNLLCNELPFLKQKLNFIYEYFDQIIFIDYDILNKCNSKDGSIEFIENFKDESNKITLLKDFNLDAINEFYGYSVIEKQKMFAYGSKYINDDIDLLWATDLDEFFDIELINVVENKYLENENLISVNIPHINLVYNQYNQFKYDQLFYIVPRVTRHYKNKIYGHCNFAEYGYTLNLTNIFLYHFSYVGYKRCLHKISLYNSKNNYHQQDSWLKIYLDNLKNNNKYININHAGSVNINSCEYNGRLPDYINCDEMINELNNTDGL